MRRVPLEIIRFFEDDEIAKFMAAFVVAFAKFYRPQAQFFTEHSCIAVLHVVDAKDLYQS